MTNRKNGIGQRPVFRSEVIAGVLYEHLPARQYCDCLKPERGFIKREDGAWVRPCCLRRAKASFDKFGDGPVPPMPPVEAAALRQASLDRINELRERVSIERLTGQDPGDLAAARFSLLMDDLEYDLE